MERFVFVAAVTIAIIFGVGAMFGGANFHFDFDDEGGVRTSALVEAAPGRLDAQTFNGEHLRLRHVAANVTVIPEDRSDYAIEIDNAAGRAPMPSVTAKDGRVTIDGHLRGRVRNCRGGGAELRGYGELSAEDLPRITIRAPRALSVDYIGAGALDVGPTESLSLELSSCATATLGDVAGELSVELAGAGEIRAGAAQRLNADVAGSGEVSVGAIAEGASVDIAGSGAVEIASLTGELKADGAGSGNLRVNGGAITTASIDLAGSGSVEIEAPVRSLNVSIVGSGNVDVDGEVGDIEADIAGSGSVDARRVTGSVSKDVLGSGEVRVGERAPASDAAAAPAPPQPTSP